MGREGGSTWTPCPRMQEVSLSSPGHASALASGRILPAPWPQPRVTGAVSGGVRARWVARSCPGEVRGAGMQLYRAVLARGAGVVSPHLPAARRKPPVKTRGQTQLKQQWFWQGTAQPPGCRQLVLWLDAHTHTSFHPCSHQEAPGTFLAACKRVMYFALTHFPFPPLRHSLR